MNKKPEIAREIVWCGLRIRPDVVRMIALKEFYLEYKLQKDAKLFCGSPALLTRYFRAHLPLESNLQNPRQGLVLFAKRASGLASVRVFEAAAPPPIILAIRAFSSALSA